jgi:hypothetical protein
VGSLEGWLVLVIFFAIAIVVVGRIQDSLSKAHEATFMYELSSALANVRTQDAVAHTTARYIKQLFRASQVNVTFQQSKENPRIAVSEPQDKTVEGRPDRILPILNAWGLVGEIQIWRGEFANLPTEDSHFSRTLLRRPQGHSSARTPLRWKNRQRFEFVHFSKTGKSPPRKSQTLLKHGKQGLWRFAIIVAKRNTI